MLRLFLISLLMLSAGAQAAGILPGHASSKAPIEINADSLQVFQEENKAIFEGHVVAIQENVRLKSDKMTVYYRSPEGEKKSEQDAIKRIEVEGNVFMTTPEETASGLSGVYDVQNNQIELINQVVLTRGKNTLKGDRLVYDLKEGKSVMSTAAASIAPNGKPAAKQRVRALFIPDEAKKKTDEPNIH